MSSRCAARDIKVAALGLKHVGLDFISKTRDDFYNQHELPGGYLILTHSSTDKKKRQVEENFMLRLKEESNINFSTHIGDYHIWGLPFYTNQNQIEFDREMKKEFLATT